MITIEEIKKDAEQLSEEATIPSHVQCITEIKRAIAKYEGYGIELEYTDLNENFVVLDNEDDILKKLHENENNVVFCVVSEYHSIVFAHTDISLIYNFIYQFRFWDPKMKVFECESYEDAYRTFFPMHELEELCYSKTK